MVFVLGGNVIKWKEKKKKNSGRWGKLLYYGIECVAMGTHILARNIQQWTKCWITDIKTQLCRYIPTSIPHYIDDTQVMWTVLNLYNEAYVNTES